MVKVEWVVVVVVEMVVVMCICSTHPPTCPHIVCVCVSHPPTKALTHLRPLPHQAVVLSMHAGNQEEEGEPAPRGEGHELVQAVEEEHAADELCFGGGVLDWIRGRVVKCVLRGDGVELEYTHICICTCLEGLAGHDVDVEGDDAAVCWCFGRWKVVVVVVGRLTYTMYTYI